LQIHLSKKIALEQTQVSLNSESFWKLLESSKLLSPTTMLQISQQLIGSPTKEPQAIAQILVEQRLISNYQAEVLLAGHAGPFHFGNFTIGDRFTGGPLTGLFKARHNPTQHPVCLEFFQGSTPADLDRWHRIEYAVSQLKSIDSPFLTSFLETVVMPNYRFVVSQRPEGVSLLERLPRRARLPWQDACTLLAQVAEAIESLHQHGIVCGGLWLGNIWVSKSGFTQFRPDLKLIGTDDHSDNDTARRVDWFQFGCCMFRVITGKPFVGSDTGPTEPSAQPLIDTFEDLKKELTKHELPAELEALCSQILFPNLNACVSGQAVKKLLSSLSKKPLASLSPTDPPTLAAFRKATSMFVPGSGVEVASVPAFEAGKPSPVIIESPQSISIAIHPTGSLMKPTESSVIAPKVRNKKWLPLVATLVGVGVFGGLLGIGAYYAANQKTPKAASVNSIQSVAADANTPSEPDSDLAALGSSASSLPPVLQQQLIQDDRSTLWQSPTEGSAMDLDGLPAGPRIVVAIRLQELLSDPEGELLIQSLGPDFARIVSSWESETGIPFSEIEELVLSLHSNEEFRYESFVRCQLKSPIEASDLMNRWGQPKPQATANGKVFYLAEGKQQGYVLLDGTDSISSPDSKTSAPADEADSAPLQDSDTITRFGFGNAKLLMEVADEPREIGGSVMRTLAERSDRFRHFNLLFLRPAVFNDEGQALMAGKWSALNRELAEILPDEIQGGSLSLHLDQGTFFELQFAQTVDLKGIELLQRLQDRFRDLRDRTTEFVAAIPPSPYWDRVRMKLSLMIVDVFRSLRWGVESGKVVANCWLPPMAAHNLIAATELAISFSAGTSTAQSASNLTVGNAPKTLDELLAIKRDLKVANPPDLNLLMADLESEIKEEFPGLPFQFRIRLIGPDLQVEGITQNQRPAELNMEQLPLNEILTAIMVSANPAKDISGPADPRCKLVWVIADDPDNPGQKMVAITTRNAADQKKYLLPPAFRIE
jgi:eukaryotic-like serine/threonine-protein kinase